MSPVIMATASFSFNENRASILLGACTEVRYESIYLVLNLCFLDLEASFLVGAFWKRSN